MAMDEDERKIIIGELQRLFCDFMGKAESLYLATGQRNGPKIIAVAISADTTEDEDEDGSVETHMFRLQNVPMPIADLLLLEVVKRMDENYNGGEVREALGTVYERMPDGQMRQIRGEKAEEILRMEEDRAARFAAGERGMENCQCDACRAIRRGEMRRGN